jgi:hypothetical protein
MTIPWMRWTCRRLRPALVDAAMGTLPLGERGRVEDHIARCALCRNDLASMRHVSIGLSAPPGSTPGEDFWRRQRQAIMRQVRTVPAPAKVAARWGSLRVAGAVATVVLALLVTRSVFPPSPPPLSRSIDHLDDEALLHLHDLLPAIAPATTIYDADSDLLSVHDLGDEELDRLAELLGEQS